MSSDRFAAFFAYPTEGGEERDSFVFLRDRPEDDWLRLLGYTEVRRFSAGETIISAGEVDRALYIVSKGRLETLLPGVEGDLHFGTIGPGSVAGEIAFLDGGPRSATIRAVSDGELIRLSFEAYEVLAARYPELGRAILLDLGRIMASRLRETNEALARAST
jgi:CRP/FNR family transcriptional regulator, cyclic AMP receptor protein